MNQVIQKLGILVLFAIPASVCATENHTSDAKSSRIHSETLPTVPLMDLLDAVSKRTGETFLVNYRAAPEVVIGSNRLRDISYPVLLSILRNNDLAASRSDGIVNIIPVSGIRQFPIPIVNKNDKSIADDDWVMRSIHVKNVRVAKFVPILRPLLPQEGHMSAHPESNTLFLVAHYGKVRLITEMVHEMDTMVQITESE